MRHQVLPVLSALLLLTSCSIQGSFKGLYSYYEKTSKDRPGLIVPPPHAMSVCDLVPTDTPKIYTINGTQLKECTGKYRDVIVYIWKPNCQGLFCYPLNVLQAKCRAVDAELFIVAEYYDGEKMVMNYDIARPLFGIDTDHYRSNLTSKYLSGFLSDLVGKNRMPGNFLYFSNGSYVKSFYALDSLATLPTNRSALHQSENPASHSQNLVIGK